MILVLNPRTGEFVPSSELEDTFLSVAAMRMQIRLESLAATASTK